MEKPEPEPAPLNYILSIVTLPLPVMRFTLIMVALMQVSYSHGNRLQANRFLIA